MNLVRSLIVAGTLSTIAVPLAAQQMPLPNGWSLAISAGIAHAGRRDETVSPLRFIGTGVAGEISMVRRSERHRVELGVLGNSASLSSDATTSDEQLSNGTARVAALWRVRATDKLRVDAGVDARFSYDDTFHHFAVAGVASTTYRLAMVTAGPAGVVELSEPWGTVRFIAAAPAFGVVDHPYSDVKNGYASLHPEAVSINRLQQFAGDLSYTTFNRPGAQLRVAVRTNVLRYRDQQSVYSVTNMLMAGFVLQHATVAR